MPAAVDALAFGEELEQRAVAAADVEDASVRFDHVGNEEMVDARFTRCRGR